MTNRDLVIVVEFDPLSPGGLNQVSLIQLADGLFCLFRVAADFWRITPKLVSELPTLDTKIHV